MTIRLTEAELYEQFQEADEAKLLFDPIDKLDTTLKFDGRFAQGWQREIELREGIYLNIAQIQNEDRVMVNSLEQACRNIRCHFTLLGKGQSIFASTPSEILLPHIAGKYYLRSNGLHPQSTGNYDLEPWSAVQIEIHPSVLRSLGASPKEELPKKLQHLVRPLSQEIYVRSGDMQPMMVAVLQQIFHSPYQGLVKRAYLESKIIELVALVLNHEVATHQGETERKILKSDQLDRIYYAKEILLKDLNNPPSLKELARQVGLNEFLLRQGFRACFDTTVFGILRSHRLELAKQLLAEQDVSVAEVAHRAGFTRTSYFSTAFKRKFGVGPKQYQKACR